MAKGDHPIKGKWGGGTNDQDEYLNIKDRMLIFGRPKTYEE